MVMHLILVDRGSPFVVVAFRLPGAPVPRFSDGPCFWSSGSLRMLVVWNASQKKEQPSFLQEKQAISPTSKQ